MRVLMFLMFLSVVGTAHAQRAVGDFVSATGVSDGGGDLRNIIDTLIPSSFVPLNEGGMGCFTGYYPSPDSGYVSGNNQFGDLEKAQLYSLSAMGYADSGSVQAVLVRFAYKTQNAYPEDVFVKIYDADTVNFQPLNLLGTSNPLNLTAISTDGSFATFTFPLPVIVDDSFFVSVQLPVSAGDTLVILSTDDNCVATHGAAWEKWSNGTWHSMLNSWILDIDLAVFPVTDVTFNVGINGLMELNSSIHLFPNPCVNTVQFTYQNAKRGETVISIYNSLAQLVEEWKQPGNPEILQQLNIDASAWLPGIYSVVVSDGEKYVSDTVVKQ